MKIRSSIISRNSLSVCGVLLTAFVFSHSAFAQTYKAPMTDSQWNFSGNRVACQIDHAIPKYGVASFQQRSGERVDFILKAEAYVPPIHMAMLSSVPPVWMHDTPALKLGKAKGDVKKLVVKADLAERMLQELANGRFPHVSYQAKPLKTKVNVTISSINFLDALSQFEACRKELLPFSREDVHQELSLFTRGTSMITHKNRKLLTKASQYVKEAGPDQRIDLISGTDEFSVKAGRAMHDKREKKVRKFLIESGLPEDKVVALDDPEALDTPARSVRLKIAGPEPFQQIYFKEGSMFLNKRDHAKLDFMLDYIQRQQPKAKLMLKGHTDSSGSRQGNIIVSKKRMAVIKKYLVSKGINASRIITKAYGESRPATTNRYPGGRQLNRRVEISIKS